MPTELAERKLSLFEIEQSLAMLMQDREEVTDPEEIAAVDAAIQQYIGAEVAKVDGCLAYLRKAQEMQAGAERAAKMYKAHVEHLKAAILFAMQTTGRKRLEGTCGIFTLKGNGGLAPLKVQEDVLPREFCDFTFRVTGETWQRLLSLLVITQWSEMAATLDAAAAVEPSNARIRAALKDGKEVPGAWLEERGQHIEVK